MSAGRNDVREILHRELYSGPVLCTLSAAPKGSRILPKNQIVDHRHFFSPQVPTKCLECFGGGCQVKLPPYTVLESILSDSTRRLQPSLSTDKHNPQRHHGVKSTFAVYPLKPKTLKVLNVERTDAGPLSSSVGTGSNRPQLESHRKTEGKGREEKRNRPKSPAL